MKPHIPKQTLYTRPSAPPTRQPFKIHTAGIILNSPYHSTLGTYNNDAMFFLVIRGKGTYRLGSQVEQLSKGMAAMITPGRDPGLLRSDINEPYEHYFCRFAGEKALETAEIIRSKRAETSTFFHLENWQTFVQIFKNLCHCSKVYHCSYKDDLFLPQDGILSYLLAMLDAEPISMKTPLNKDNLVKYFHEHINEPMDMDAVASYFNVTKSHLCRKGKVLLNQTPLSFWREIKIEWAKMLLAEQSLPVHEVSRMTGYEDPFYFSSSFRKITGSSPSKWTLRHAKSNGDN